MKALHYEGPFKVAVKEVPLPKLEHPDDAIIKVTTAGTSPQSSLPDCPSAYSSSSSSRRHTTPKPSDNPFNVSHSPFPLFPPPTDPSQQSAAATCTCTKAGPPPNPA